MLINFKKKYVFVRSTKVASTSLIKTIWEEETRGERILAHGGFLISNSMLALTDDSTSKKRLSFPKKFHLSLHEVKELFRGDEFDNFFKFSIVRNPYSHAISRFLYEEVIVKKLFRNFFKLNNRRRLALLKSFVMKPNNEIIFKIFLKNFYKGQKKFLGENLDDFNYLLRFESLEKDFQIIKKEFGLKAKINFLNKHKDTSSYIKNLYDEECIDLVYQNEKHIIERFNYKFPLL